MFRTALVALDLLDVLPIERPLLRCLPDLQNWGIGKIVLAHVIHDSHGQSISAVHKKSCLEDLEHCAKPLRECGFDVAAVVRESSRPADDILAIARDNSADLIVIGSGMGGLTVASLMAQLEHQRVLVLERHFQTRRVHSQLHTARPPALPGVQDPR